MISREALAAFKAGGNSFLNLFMSKRSAPEIVSSERFRGQEQVLTNSVFTETGQDQGLGKVRGIVHTNSGI